MPPRLAGPLWGWGRGWASLPGHRHLRTQHTSGDCRLESLGFLGFPRRITLTWVPVIRLKAESDFSSFSSKKMSLRDGGGGGGGGQLNVLPRALLSSEHLSFL